LKIDFWNVEINPSPVLFRTYISPFAEQLYLFFLCSFFIIHLTNILHQAQSIMLETSWIDYWFSKQKDGIPLWGIPSFLLPLRRL